MEIRNEHSFNRLTCTDLTDNEHIEPWKPNREVDPEYPYYCYRDERGVINYYVPLEAPNDLPIDKCAGAKKIRYSWLSFPGGARIKVYWERITDRELAMMQRRMINNDHARECRYAKRYITVADTNPEMDGSIWDNIRNDSYEPRSFPTVETTVFAGMELQNVIRVLSEKNPRHWQIFSRKEIDGESAETVAEEFGISEVRVYQIVASVRKTAQQYREEEM